MKSKMVFMAEKQKEYSTKKEKLASMLRKTGYREELNQEAIVKLKYSLDEAKETLKTMKSKLESYRSLPPNSLSARARLAEAEGELEELSKVLAIEFSNLHV